MCVQACVVGRWGREKEERGKVSSLPGVDSRKVRSKVQKVPLHSVQSCLTGSLPDAWERNMPSSNSPQNVQSLEEK